MMYSQLISLMVEPYASAELNYRRERIMRQYPRRTRRSGTGRVRLVRPHVHLPWPRRRARQRTAVA